MNGNSTDFAEIVKSSLDRIEAAVTLLPDKSYIQNGINETIESILDTRLEVLTASDKGKSVEKVLLVKSTHFLFSIIQNWKSY